MYRWIISTGNMRNLTNKISFKLIHIWNTSKSRIKRVADNSPYLKHPGKLANGISSSLEPIHSSFPWSLSCCQNLFHESESIEIKIPDSMLFHH